MGFESSFISASDSDYPDWCVGCQWCVTDHPKRACERTVRGASDAARNDATSSCRVREPPLLGDLLEIPDVVEYCARGASGPYRFLLKQKERRATVLLWDSLEKGGV